MSYFYYKSLTFIINIILLFTFSIRIANTNTYNNTYYYVIGVFVFSLHLFGRKINLRFSNLAENVVHFIFNSKKLN